MVTGGPRIALVSLGSPRSRASWSGTPFHILAELERRFGPVQVIDTPRLDRLLIHGSRLARLGLLPFREPLVSAWFGRRLSQRLRQAGAEVVVAIAAEGKVAALAGDWPMVVISDSFFANMVTYYDRYAGLSGRTLANGHAQQRRLLDAGAVVLLSSAWAACTAARDYGVPLSRFRVAPFGANLTREPDPPADRLVAGPLKLLFVGYDWARKGGDLVLESFLMLREHLPDAELHIVGARPPAAANLAGVFRHGPLRKGRPAEAAQLEGLFMDASLFMMPSRQEAYGLVYAEACAYGLPSVAAETGGVASVVEHGVSGLLLGPDARAADYAAAILELWRDRRAYRRMRLQARAAYEARLNWRAWGDAAEAAVREAMAGAGGPSVRGAPASSGMT